MNSEHSNPADYNFPLRENDELRSEIRTRHLGVIENHLKRHSYEYLERKFKQDHNFEEYQRSLAIVRDLKIKIILEAGTVVDVGKEEYDYPRFVREFIDPNEQASVISYIHSELEQL